MIRDARGGIWMEAALFAVASVLLAQMGLGVFFFLVPLQVLYARRGQRPLLASGALAVVAIAAVRVIEAAARGALERGKGLLIVEVVTVTLLVIGLVLVDTFDRRTIPLLGIRLRAVPRLLAATAVAAAACCPVVLFMRGQPDLGDAVTGLFRQTAESIASVLAQGTKGLAGVEAIDATGLATRMYQVALEVFPRSVALYYFGTLTFSWWAGARSAARSIGVAPKRLVDFALPDGYVWPLIASLAMVLADVAFGISPLGYVGWNVGLIMLLLYGMQGLGIIQFAFARYRVGRTLRILVYSTLAVLFVSPGANAVVAIGLPAVGVSEIWLKYRTRRRNEDADEGDP